MNFPRIGIRLRLALAFLPWITGEAINARFSGCFFSESPFCIYYFHPPGMDVVFALLVLAPFIQSHARVALRVFGLIVLSVLVHSLAVSILVDTRGSLEIPGIDSIFLNVIPVAIGASVTTVLIGAFLCGFKVDSRLAACAALAGLPVAFTFLLADLLPETSWFPLNMSWYWAVWHVSIFLAMFYGRSAAMRDSL